MPIHSPRTRTILGLFVILGGCTLLARAEGVDEGQAPAEPKQPVRPLAERLKIPPELPGANAPPIPATVSSKDRAQREAAVERLYGPLPPPGPLPQAAPGPEGRPLSLPDLQQLALEHSPVIRQAAADVEAARGAAIQAGAYPNPNFGYEADNIRSGGTAGFQGVFLDQTIKTAGKLKLAQAAAVMDLRNAEVALRRVEVDLLTQVRSGYFAVLVAEASVRITTGLARFTEEVYRIQVDQLKGGEAAAYEPMQLRVLALQARAARVQAHNRYVSAWKQLAATLGLPCMPLTELAGKVEMPIPRATYDQAVARVMAAHTDVLTAENTALRARYNLRLAEVTPIPDVLLHGAVQKDYTVEPFNICYNVQVGVALPLWDRNKGGILQAQGQLARALDEGHRVRNDLTQRLADAFERYENNRIILNYYRQQILPDQVRAYRGVFERHGVEPDKVSFGDVVTAQQTLATTITAYVSALNDQWKAVVDVAGLLQVDDLFAMGDGECFAPLPDLGCCPPDGHWPPADQPAAETAPAPKRQE